MNKHKSNKIKENSNTVRHLIMGQIITTQNLVAIKEVRHAGQWFWFLSNEIKVTKHACTSSWLPIAHTIHHTYHHVTTMNKQQISKSYNQHIIYIYIYIHTYISHVNVTQTVPDISPLMPMHQDPLLVVRYCNVMVCVVYCVGKWQSRGSTGMFTLWLFVISCLTVYAKPL